MGEWSIETIKCCTSFLVRKTTLNICFLNESGGLSKKSSLIKKKLAYFKSASYTIHLVRHDFKKLNIQKLPKEIDIHIVSGTTMKAVEKRKLTRICKGYKIKFEALTVERYES